MNKDKMVKVRLLRDGGFKELNHLPFPMDVDAKISKQGRGIDVHQSQFGLKLSRSTTETESLFFTNREYELITEEETAPPQQTIEQLLFTRKEYFEDIDKTKKMILDIDQEIKGRLNSAGWDY